jgi:hypothetical protein
MKSKSAYTLIEGLMSMLIIGMVSVAAIGFASGYFKDTFHRDVQTKAVIENINILEKVKAEVVTLSQLYTFSQEHDIKIIAVGIGEVSFSESGEINIISDEKYGFSQKVMTDESKLFRIEIGGDMPNAKLITIIRLEG